MQCFMQCRVIVVRAVQKTWLFSEIELRLYTQERAAYKHFGETVDSR